MVPPPARNNEWFDVVPQATDIDRELKKAVFLSRETNRPAYSQVISLTVPKDDPMMSERQSVFLGGHFNLQRWRSDRCTGGDVLQPRDLAIHYPA